MTKIKLTKEQKQILKNEAKIDQMKRLAEEQAQGASMRARNRGWSEAECEQAFWDAFNTWMQDSLV